jgi:hypothetical protein
LLACATACASTPVRVGSGVSSAKQFLEVHGEEGIREADVADGLDYISQAADFCRFFLEVGCQDVLDAQDRVRKIRFYSGQVGERLIAAHVTGSSRRTIRKIEDEQDHIDRAYLGAIEFAIEKSSVVLGDTFVAEHQSSAHKF